MLRVLDRAFSVYWCACPVPVAVAGIRQRADECTNVRRCAGQGCAAIIPQRGCMLGDFEVVVTGGVNKIRTLWGYTNE